MQPIITLTLKMGAYEVLITLDELGRCHRFPAFQLYSFQDEGSVARDDCWLRVIGPDYITGRRAGR